MVSAQFNWESDPQAARGGDETKASDVPQSRTYGTIGVTEENSRLAQAKFCMSVEWLMAGRGSGTVQSRNWEGQMMEVWGRGRVGGASTSTLVWR